MCENKKLIVNIMNKEVSRSQTPTDEKHILFLECF